MTNTNDYRQYSFANDTAALLAGFDYQRSVSYAPKVRPAENPAESIKVREKIGIKSRQELKKEARASRKNALAVMAVAVLCAFMLGMVVNSLAQKNQLTRQIAAQEIEIANAQSEYVSLESKLNSLVSMSMIDEYAVEKLGMRKMRSNQIQYMDVSEFKAQREKKLAPKEIDGGIKRLREKFKGIND